MCVKEIDTLLSIQIEYSSLWTSVRKGLVDFQRLFRYLSSKVNLKDNSEPILDPQFKYSQFINKESSRRWLFYNHLTYINLLIKTRVFLFRKEVLKKTTKILPNTISNKLKTLERPKRFEIMVRENFVRRFVNSESKTRTEYTEKE